MKRFVTEENILESFDNYELDEIDLLELYSEGYISENTMDQLIEINIIKNKHIKKLILGSMIGIRLANNVADIPSPNIGNGKVVANKFLLSNRMKPELNVYNSRFNKKIKQI